MSESGLRSEEMHLMNKKMKQFAGEFIGFSKQQHSNK